MLEYSGLGKDR